MRRRDFFYTATSLTIAPAIIGMAQPDLIQLGKAKYGLPATKFKGAIVSVSNGLVKLRTEVGFDSIEEVKEAGFQLFSNAEAIGMIVLHVDGKPVEHYQTLFAYQHGVDNAQH